MAEIGCATADRDAVVRQAIPADEGARAGSASALRAVQDAAFSVFDGKLIGPLVSGDNYDVLAIYSAFEWRRCHRQLIARRLHLIRPGGADP